MLRLEELLFPSIANVAVLSVEVHIEMVRVDAHCTTRSVPTFPQPLRLPRRRPALAAEAFEAVQEKVQGEFELELVVAAATERGAPVVCGRRGQLRDVRIVRRKSGVRWAGRA